MPLDLAWELGSPRAPRAAMEEVVEAGRRKTTILSHWPPSWARDPSTCRGLVGSWRYCVTDGGIRPFARRRRMKASRRVQREAGERVLRRRNAALVTRECHDGL